SVGRGGGMTARLCGACWLQTGYPVCTYSTVDCGETSPPQPVRNFATLAGCREEQLDLFGVHDGQGTNAGAARTPSTGAAGSVGRGGGMTARLCGACWLQTGYPVCTYSTVDCGETSPPQPVRNFATLAGCREEQLDLFGVHDGQGTNAGAARTPSTGAAGPMG